MSFSCAWPSSGRSKQRLELLQTRKLANIGTIKKFVAFLILFNEKKCSLEAREKEFIFRNNL